MKRFALLTLALAACGTQKQISVDDALIEETTGTQSSEASTAWTTVKLDTVIQSRHPYTNEESIVQSISATTCASEFQVHFASLATEKHYDFVTVEQNDGSSIVRYTGKKNGTWSKSIKGSLGRVRLDSDETIDGQGFVIDKVRYVPGAHMMCPAVMTKQCDPGLLNVTALRDPCKCPAYTPTCADAKTFSASLRTNRAIQGHFNVTRIDGEGNVYDQINMPLSRPEKLRGKADPAAFADFVWTLKNEHFFDNTYAPFEAVSSQVFAATLGAEKNEKTVADSFAVGENRFVDQFKSLIRCGGEGGLTCASGSACQTDGSCL